jgi:N-acetylneuraminic acid mutarotase
MVFWTVKAEMPPPIRFGFSISAVNRKIYVIGGGLHGDIMTSIVEVYDTGLGIKAEGKLATSWGKLKALD